MMADVFRGNSSAQAWDGAKRLPVADETRSDRRWQAKAYGNRGMNPAIKIWMGAFPAKNRGRIGLARQKPAVSVLELAFVLGMGIGIGVLLGSHRSLRKFVGGLGPLARRRQVDYQVLRQ